MIKFCSKRAGALFSIGILIGFLAATGNSKELDAQDSVPASQNLNKNGKIGKFGNQQADQGFNQDFQKSYEFEEMVGLELPSLKPSRREKIEGLSQKVKGHSAFDHPSRNMVRQLRNKNEIKNSKGRLLSPSEKVLKTKRKDQFYGAPKTSFPGHLVQKPEVSKEKLNPKIRKYPGRKVIEDRLKASRSLSLKKRPNIAKQNGGNIQLNKESNGSLRAKRGSSLLGTDDAYEPNDYRSDAYDLSYDEGSWLSTVEGFGIQFDDDYYEIYVDPSYLELTVELDFDHSEGDIDLAVYNSNGFSVASSSGVSNGEYINVEVSSGGYYYIKAHYADAGNYYDLIWYTDYTGPVFSEDSYEPNDSRSSAYDLSYDEDTWLSSLDGYGAQFDEDWYEIYVDYFYQRVILDLRFNDDEGDIDLALYNSNGNLVSSSSGSSDDEYIDFTVSEPGYYYVKIYYGNQGNPYDFKWYTLAGGNPFEEDVYENNDSIGSAYDLSSRENTWLDDILGLGSQFDDDFYAIYVDPGYQRVIVDLRFEDDYGDIDLQLKNAGGTTVASSTSSSDDEYVDFTVATPGWYYIRVYNANTGNSYDMKWYTLQGGAFEDNYEPNDSFGSAFDLRNYENEWLSQISGLGTQTDEDYFLIQVDPDFQELTVDLRFTHSNGDIDLILYNSSYQQVAASRSSNNDEFINLVVSQPGQYYLKVFHGNQGNSYDLLWYTESTYSNTSLPATPTNFAAVASGSDTVLLDWNWNDSNYDPTYQDIDNYRFEIQRWEIGVGDWITIVETENVDFLYFDDVTVQPGKSYKYRVRAKNRNGLSSWSNESQVAVPDLVPARPSSFSGSATSPNRVFLQWVWQDGQYNGQAGYGFNISRRVANGEWSNLQSLEISAREYIDNTVGPGTNYEYRIRAYNSYGPSSWSNSTSVSVPNQPTPVAAPENLLAFQSGERSIHLTWNDRASNEQSFEVERRNLSGGAFQSIGTVSAIASNIRNRVGSFTDSTVVAGNSYEYRVRARGQLVSNYSNTSSAQVSFSGSPCVQNGTTICLLSNRYELKVFWRNQHGTGETGVGHRLAGPQTDQSGFLWFFSSDNVELVVKAINASSNPAFDHNWIFSGALSDVEYYVVVRETDTGVVKTYHNTQGNYCGNADAAAFSQEPGVESSSHFQDLNVDYAPSISSRTEAPSTCVANANTLCLNNRRFQVRVNWDTTGVGTNSQQGPGVAIPQSNLTGLFWFFSPSNIELIVKVIDGTGLNGKFWVFYGALSTVRYDLEVKDTLTGLVKTYSNQAGNICGVPDTEAF